MCLIIFPMLYEALQDQSTAVPIIKYGTVAKCCSSLHRLQLLVVDN